ncbi:MAG: hypothetical protein K6F80_05970 [Oscillospiraceae bacterium]|nr:hypothetical protein [Oscillospiraceae bacterium]
MKVRTPGMAVLTAVMLVCCACGSAPRKTEPLPTESLVPVTDAPTAAAVPVSETESPSETEPIPETAAETPPQPADTVGDEGDFIYAPLHKLDGSMPSQGSAKLAVFYVDFPDCRFRYEPSLEELNAYCFGESYEETNKNYPFITMRSFLNRSSKGIMDLTGQVFRYTTTENKYVYETVEDDNGFLVNDENKQLLMEELFANFDDMVDFSQFDGNGDGVIDELLICVPRSADEEYWWPASKEYHYDLEADGVRLGYFVVGSTHVNSVEDHRDFAATFLHESGHCMGLPDYYLLCSGDQMEGLNGDAGNEMMDENYSDFGCFSKLMLGWYREKQVQIYDQNIGGEQTFCLRDAQGEHGNCLILPAGQLDENFFSEYIILEYITDTGNNVGINRYKKRQYRLGEGIRAYHVCAARCLNATKHYVFTYANNEKTPEVGDGGIRLIRLVNDAEGGGMFRTGDVLNGSLSGFHWYAADQSETAETGYTVTVGELTADGYTVTVTRQ